ncbi:MAG: hypothetical protein MUF19_02465 [Candidatus Pacebacteria bacterium]|jgi:hypothetical protein|nr:hypothetical protein [Candidatus Paceibacterota bacterium]
MFIKVLMFAAAILCAAPAFAQQPDYLTQEEMLAILARGGTTPKAMGMLPLRVCQVIGEPRGEGSRQATPKQVTSTRIYGDLVRFADRMDREKPKWDWETRCYKEYHQVTPQLRATLHPSMIVRETTTGATRTATADKPAKAASAAGAGAKKVDLKTTFTYRGKTYRWATDEQIRSFNACRPTYVRSLGVSILMDGCRD